MQTLRYRLLNRLKLICGIGLAALSIAVAAATPPDPVGIYMYRGADRDQRLLEGARKEGMVTLYTSINTRDSIPITDAFTKKYGIKVEMWRGGSEKVVQRTVTEARAGRFTPDVIDTNGPEMEALYREKLLAEFYTPSFRDIPSVAFPPHRHYVAERFNFFTIAYNSNLVKPENVPNSYQDLLDPRWVGKIGVEAGDVDWFAAMVKSMGEKAGLDYFTKLAQMQPQVRVDHTLMVQLLAVGEIQLLAATYNHNVEREAQKGAAVKWKALAPTFGRPNAIAVTRNAPHPHSGLLFAEFMLSREGQELIKSRHRIPVSTAVTTSLNQFKYEMIDPVIVLDEASKWDKLWDRLFLKGRGAPKKENE